MIKEYLISHIKNNKNTSISIVIISFFASLLLSVLCGVFYNLFAYDMQAGKTYGIGENVASIVIMGGASLSLILMIHNVFLTSMSSRMHQLGILKSVGATPKQIKAILKYEIILLSIPAIVIGAIVGIGGTYLFMQIAIKSTEFARDYELHFQYNILVWVISILVSLITVWISSSIPARKISKISVMNAIFYRENTKIKKMKKFSISSKIMGVEGEIARKSIYSRRKSFRTASRSFMFSALALITFLNFEAVSDLSTNKTFFERYRDKWDIMFLIPETNNRNELIEEIRNMDNVKECIGYKKYNFYAQISTDYLSKEANEAGGLDVISEKIKKNENQNYKIGVPIIALDNMSFNDYYKSLGKNVKGNPASEDKCIAINKLWKSKNHNLEGEYIPYLKENDNLELKLFEKENESKSYNISVTNYAEELPKLKEEYNRHECEFVLIISEDYANKINKDIMTGQTYFNIKLDDVGQIDNTQAKIEEKISTLDYRIQNRINEEISDKNERKGMIIIIEIFAGILACIGFANVFSNALGQIAQRKREFARYMSIGLSAKGMRKILIYEDLIISLKPIIISIVINIPIVLFFLNASQMLIKDYLTNMPIIPILVYTMFILIFTSVAYYIGGKKILNKNIMEQLKNDTLY